MIAFRPLIIALGVLGFFLRAGDLSADARYIEFTGGTIHVHLTVGKIHKLAFPEEITDIFVPSASKVSLVHKKDHVYIKPLVPFEGVFLLEGVGRDTYELSVKADGRTSHTIFKILNQGITQASGAALARPPVQSAGPHDPPKVSLIKAMIRGDTPAGYEVQDVADLGLRHPALLKSLSSKDLDYKLERIYTSPTFKGLVIGIENVSKRRQFIDITRIEYPGCVIRAVLDKYLYPPGPPAPDDGAALLERPSRTRLYIVLEEKRL